MVWNFTRRTWMRTARFFNVLSDVIAPSEKGAGNEGVCFFTG